LAAPEPNPIGDKGSLGLSRLGDVDYRGYVARSPPVAETRRRRWQPTAPSPHGADRMLGRHTVRRARIAALLGEHERAVAHLREALQQGRTYLLLHAEADFDALRDIPAFQELVRPKQ
jgi:hypothetical protein